MVMVSTGTGVTPNIIRISRLWQGKITTGCHKVTNIIVFAGPSYLLVWSPCTQCQCWVTLTLVNTLPTWLPSVLEDLLVACTRLTRRRHVNTLLRTVEPTLLWSVINYSSRRSSPSGIVTVLQGVSKLFPCYLLYLLL